MKTLVFENMQAFGAMKGKELPTSDWIAVSQEMIDHFANATLDKQWIHIDVVRAKKESPFKSTIAHGFMSVALLSQFLNSSIKIESVKMGLNYGLDYVRFINPVPVNSLLRLHSRVKEMASHTHGVKVIFSCSVEIKGEDKPACIAEFIALFME